jgi:hypothetical protein
MKLSWLLERAVGEPTENVGTAVARLATEALDAALEDDDPAADTEAINRAGGCHRARRSENDAGRADDCVPPDGSKRAVGWRFLTSTPALPHQRPSALGGSLPSAPRKCRQTILHAHPAADALAEDGLRTGGVGRRPQTQYLLRGPASATTVYPRRLRGTVRLVPGGRAGHVHGLGR